MYCDVVFFCLDYVVINFCVLICVVVKGIINFNEYFDM